MLHIILTILKIIGILILVVLALLLTVIGVVLFVPIRYRVNGKKDEESFFVKAEVYWLLHLFRIKAVYPEPGRVIVKILCFTIYDSGKVDESEKSQRKKKEENSKVKKKNVKSNSKEKEKKLQKEVQTNEKDGKIKENTEKEANERKTAAPEQNIELSTNAQAEAGTEPQKGKIGQAINKMKAIIQKVLSILKNIRYTITRLCDKIKEIWANIQYYVEVFHEEETNKAFLMCKQQLYKIWKNISPSKCRVQLKIGTGEPDTTGYILAVHGMLYPLIGNNVMIEPDFEKQVLEGTVFIKGRITIFVLLCVAIKLYFDENIRHFLKRFKREE